MFANLLAIADLLQIGFVEHGLQLGLKGGHYDQDCTDHDISASRSRSRQRLHLRRC
jgi:hypothetical protein